MVSNFLMNNEEIALVLNFRKLTTEQRETISFICSDIGNSVTPRLSLAVDNSKELTHALKVVGT